MNYPIWRRFDYGLFGATILLVIFGILMIASATQGAIDPTIITRVPDQIRFAVLGVVIMFGLALIDYRTLGGLSTWLYVLMIILLVMVFFFGVEGDAGAQSWINIGIRIQPSEVAKVLIILTLGQYLARNYERMGQFSTLLMSLVHLGIPAVLIFIQPDLGMTTVFAAVWFAMIWGAGLRLKHIVLFALVASLAGSVILLQAFKVIDGPLEDYQISRITTFI
ncbi:MAG: FtsW/RodA/SpoVE family cell cycle protein, partial [Anaerolineae bacterium]|nr:FtsW/RodA/SpoVE family cell cycle protein [Anaerolineae bacterium]